MPRWQEVVREPHRHPISQVIGGYALGSWLAYTGVATLYESLGLPDWVPWAAIALILIGLPIVVATALVQRRLPQVREFFGRRAVDDVGAAGGRYAPDGLLSWRRSIPAGFGAFAILAMASLGVIAANHRGTLLAQGYIDSDEPVLLADFSTTGPDSSLAATITEAVRADLLQSRVLRLAQPPQIEIALAHMRRTPKDGLSADVAREMAEREGFKAIITGEVSPIGNGYTLIARVLSADTVVATFRETAKDSTALIDAVNSLSKQMRTKIGEPLKSIRASVPLDRATTGSVAAWRKFSEASRVQREQGDEARVVALLEEAVAIDTLFADAWRKIGMSLNTLGTRREDKFKALTRAYELRDRLTEVEKYNAIGSYMHVVKRDYNAAIAAYQQALAIDSLYTVAVNNLPFIFIELGRFADAEPILKSLQPGTRGGWQWKNLIETQVDLGKIEDAWQSFEAARGYLPLNTRVATTELAISVAEHRWDRVDSIARALALRFRDNEDVQKQTMNVRLDAALVEGRLRQADAVSAQIMETNSEPQWSGVWREFDLATFAIVRGDTAAAHRLIDDVQRKARPDTVAGRRIVRSADELRILASWHIEPSSIPDLRGRVGKARCTNCNLDHLGMAFEAAGQLDSARATYDRYLDVPSFNRFDNEAIARPMILLRVAALDEVAGDTVRAIARYSEFARLWARADADLQPRVRAAQERIRALRRKPR